jgi:cell division protein FtsN
MARYERGTYEPSDEVRVFDGAEEEDDAEGSRLPLLIVLALLVLFAFAGVVWLAYTQGVARGRTETPVLAAAPGPEKVAPQNAGGTNVQYQGFKIYEQPAPPDDEADAAPPSAPPEQAAKVETPPAAKVEPPPAPKPAPVQQAVPAKPEPAPKVVATAPPPAANPTPVTTPAPAAPRPMAPPPAIKQAVTPPPAAPSATATGAPRTLPGVATATTPAPKPAAAPKPATGGSFVLQIAAFKSQAEADAAWKTYKAKHAALLSGYGSDVQKADLGEKGTWYRLRVAGFADRDVASALCDRLKADGGGGCIVGK